MTGKTPPRKRGRPRKQRPLASTSQFRLIRANLHERAFERLRTMIVRGKLQPGAQLIETELCDLLQVSRTPLREALKLLAAQGLVELRQNRSARITPLRIDAIRDLFETMSNVERLAAESAAARITDAGLAELRQLQDEIQKFGEAGDLDGYFAANQKIHSAIAVAASNTVLLEIHELLFPRAERARFFALSSRRRWQESIEEHRAILEALEARQAETAGRLMADHVHHTGQEVVQILAADPALSGVAA
jgi:DNA-binding GntR family transcriptional regulator